MYNIGVPGRRLLHMRLLLCIVAALPLLGRAYRVGSNAGGDDMTKLTSAKRGLFGDDPFVTEAEQETFQHNILGARAGRRGMSPNRVEAGVRKAWPAVRCSGALSTLSTACHSTLPANLLPPPAQAQQIWIVNFYAPWCPHCKHFAPTVRHRGCRAHPTCRVARDGWGGIVSWMGTRRVL